VRRLGTPDLVNRWQSALKDLVGGDKRLQDAEKGLRPPRKACDGTDAARGVLASIVFISHIVQILVGDVYMLGVAPQLSVLFFFAISGFVISGSLVRHTAQDGTVDLVGFAKRRFFRIMPPLIATFLLVAALEVALVFSGVLGAGREAAGIYGYHLSLLKVTISLLSLGAIGDLGGGLDGPLWSLRYEIRCYLTAAVVVWLLTSRATVERKAGVVAALSAYWFVAFFIRNEGPLSQLPWLLSFAAGFVVFRYQSALAATGWVGVASAVVVALAAVFYLFFSSSEGATMWLLFVTCICGCSFAVIVFTLHNVTIRSGALFALGGVSYTLYIAHFPILLAFYLLIKAAPATMYVPLALASAIVAAVVCFALGRLIERPSAQLAWAERQFSRIRTMKVMRASQA
jgi:peptidoglycan/LPS O-acetylase OafA/YrhL